MRSTVVPAQVTTVEDRIAGSLGLSQLLLLLVPVFIGSILYVVLPPFFAYHVYKLILIVVLAVVCGLLAIRIKGQILLLWLISILRYNLRPRFFVYSKNSLYARENVTTEQIDAEEPSKVEVVESSMLPNLSTTDLIRIQDLLANPAANVRFSTTKKGELRVHVTEI